MSKKGVDAQGRSCSIEGCRRKFRARGFCATHYARFMRNNTPHLAEVPDSVQCSAPSCSKPPRSRIAKYCETHYYRLRRTGSVADPVRISGACRVDGCERLASLGDNFCRLHYLRIKNRGDVTFENRGPNCHTWTGEDATYKAVHQRVRAKYGSARDLTCIDCGGPAKHWSYDHTDPNSRFQEGKGDYSTDIEKYDPRCVKCHKRFDMDRVMQSRRAGR